MLLAIAYGFFTALRSLGHIPLSLTLSELAQRNPQAQTYVVTFLATALSALSSYWTALLAPSLIVIPTPLEGTEVNLLSEAFNNQFDQLWNATPGLQSYRIGSAMDASGTAAASATLSIVDFAGWEYPVATRGILPINLVDSADPGSNSTGLFITDTKPFPFAGSDFNTSAIQQGVTALTACKYQQLDANTDPPLERVTDSVQITVGDQPTLYTAVGSATTCGRQTLRSDALSSTNNILLTTSCGSTEDTGQIVYTVIIDGQGLYSGTLVCTVWPMIQTIVVMYSGRTAYTDLYTPVDLSMTPAPAAIAYAVLYSFSQAVAYSQTATHNVVGDSIATILADHSQQLSYPDLWEAYIRGVVEFAGTAIKTNLVSPTGPLGGVIPSNMRQAINGTALTTTYGWEYNAGINNAILIPSTFVAIASILIVLFAHCMRLMNRGVVVEHVDFDPNEPLLLMAAASAGGMEDTFHGLAKGDLEEGGEKKVILAHFGNRDGLFK
ncbi:hypothetical protein DFH09DRAFT_1275438 [Mycena vulgaris]|nr:hypothetical protein DFH09DRAFT_1275438 [Mycena vulgaris]